MNFSPMTVELIPLILTLISTSARSLKMVSLKVPPTTDIFEPVTLSCEYELQNRKLYSVKWYKDESEFFRYMPDYQPQCQAFPTPGISLDLQKSDMNRVTLIDLQFSTSGNYKCEVSTEGPNFQTVYRISNMTVMAFPREDPMIEGVLSTYLIGDYVTANCTSGKSNPPADMSWEINGVKAESSVREYNKGADETDAQSLHTKTVALEFQIRNELFTNNGRSTNLKMEIRCNSTVGKSVRYKVASATIVKAQTSNQLAQEGFRNSASFSVTSSVNIIFMLITSLHAVYSS